MAADPNKPTRPLLAGRSAVAVGYVVHRALHALSTCPHSKELLQSLVSAESLPASAVISLLQCCTAELVAACELVSADTRSEVAHRPSVLAGGSIYYSSSCRTVSRIVVSALLRWTGEIGVLQQRLSSAAHRDAQKARAAP